MAFNRTMDPLPALQAIGTAAAIGLLIGLERQRAPSPIGGIRTFPLIAAFGALCGLLAAHFGLWLPAAGMVAVAAMLAIGNLGGQRDESPGITSEVAALLVYLLGAWLAVEGSVVPVVVGGAVAVLLHSKAPLHGLVERLGQRDLNALMRFVVITLVVLPILPDRTFGPYQVLNPRNIWWMVVLIVGISLGGYVLYKLCGAKAGTVLGGILGGMISSTATTASFARRARLEPTGVGLAATVVVVASTVALGRVLVEIAVVAPGHVLLMAWPVLTIMVTLAVAAVLLLVGATGDRADLPDQGNPAELKSALVFAGLYAVVTVAVAASKAHFGTNALYVVAVISGLTDMDAITLSTSRLVHEGSLTADQGWRIVVMAVIANLVFKGGMAWVLGGWRLGWRVGGAFLLTAVVGLCTIWFWPAVGTP